MNGNGRARNFTGIAKQQGDGWWAYCNQVPVCAFGSSFNEALQNLMESIEAYHEPLNGTRGGPPAKMRFRPDLDSATPFRITVDISSEA